jgi:hypothetical protein
VVKEGRQLELLDVSAGGETAAGDGPKVHCPEVVVGLHETEAPGRFQCSAQGAQMLVGRGRGVAPFAHRPGQGGPDGGGVAEAKVGPGECVDVGCAVGNPGGDGLEAPGHRPVPVTGQAGHVAHPLTRSLRIH